MMGPFVVLSMFMMRITVVDPTKIDDDKEDGIISWIMCM